MSRSLLLPVLLAIAVGPYLAGGVINGYFAGDDFHGSMGRRHSAGWQRAFDLSSRSASYRPVIDLYFVAGKLGVRSIERVLSRRESGRARDDGRVVVHPGTCPVS